MIARRRLHVLTERADELAPLAGGLRAAGFAVDVGDALPSGSPDLVIVDVTAVGWDVVEDVVGDRLVLLVPDPRSMQRGFALGADDCVLVSAHPDEVAARCEAILRRTSSAPAPRGRPSVYVDRRLWINFDSRQVWVAGQAVHLTPREFRLLRHLVQSRDRTLSHDEILEAVWGRSDDSERPTEVLKQYIWRLRQKLELDPNAPDTIVTEAGEGYRFVAHAP